MIKRAENDNSTELHDEGKVHTKNIVKSNISVNPLDGCLHVFIDLGSNRGLQIRKLYEPHHFPLAPVLPLYERFFGKPETRKLQEICSVCRFNMLLKCYLFVCRLHLSLITSMQSTCTLSHPHTQLVVSK